MDNKFNEQLSKFYKKVIARIRTADAVLILGPGEAKGEFQKHIIHKKVNVPIVGIKTVDKMTDRQIAAKVRKYFREASAVS